MLKPYWSAVARGGRIKQSKLADPPNPACPYQAAYTFDTGTPRRNPDSANVNASPFSYSRRCHTRMGVRETPIPNRVHSESALGEREAHRFRDQYPSNSLVRYAVIHSNGIEYAINEHLLDEPDPFAIDTILEFGSFESAPEVADPRQIKVERRLINLPLRGQTNLLILRAQPGSGVVMDLLENAVRSAERFMGVPFPTDQVTLRFTELNVTKGYSGSFMPGTFSGGQVQILPIYDRFAPSNEKRLAEIIAHEVAHYYWHHHANWIDEGMAEILTAYIENDRVATPIVLF